MLAMTFLALWRVRPDQPHLPAFALAFACMGIAFAANDFILPFEAPASRMIVNLLFVVATVIASLAVLWRVGAPVPATSFSVAFGLCAIAFGWFLLGDPSTEMRIYVVNATYVVLAGITVFHLVRARPANALDWTFIALGTGLIGLAILRPLATLLHQLDINSVGSLRNSAYWATVQAFTPVVAVAIGLAALIALAHTMFEELHVEADRDFLTGLLNRRGLDRQVRKALTYRSGTVGRPALILVDIDNFKRINDTFGHPVGDGVIAAVAAILARHGGATAAARTGGEEFTLFYANADRNDLLRHAEAIRHAMTLGEFEGVTRDHRVTVSMGLHLRHEQEDMMQMAQAADRALYLAKRSGKDRAVIAPLVFRSASLDPLQPVPHGAHAI